MKKMLKIVPIVIIFMVLIMMILVKYTKAVEDIDGKIELECVDKIEPGKNVTINVKLSNIKKNVDTVIALIEYDENIFEDIVEDDIVPTNNWNYPIFNEEDSILLIEKTGGTTEDEIIMSIVLKVKENVQETSTILKLSDLEIAGLGEDLKFDKTVEIKVGETQEPTEKLYLSSEIYKIGNNDIKNYEDGDKYISRVNKETTKQSFISNLNTNGAIRIIKEDGTELGENELVGTGMTLEVTKDEEKIELKIAVMGDLNGDGKVTATDLSTLNQTILKLVTLENEYKIAADLDENNQLTATDLSTINKILLKLL